MVPLKKGPGNRSLSAMLPKAAIGKIPPRFMLGVAVARLSAGVDQVLDLQLVLHLFHGRRWIDAERDEALLGKASADGVRGGKVVHHEEAAQYFGVGPRKCPGMICSSGCVG